MAREGVNTETGEVVALPVKYDPREYLATLSKNDGLQVQHALAAAYDAACASLIGPNDVQVESGRSFKKKSAWRKLARYFNISVEIAKVERDVLEHGHFLATVTARAVAPWGQSYEEVGACCTDEATGRRVITIADAIATASTRASNRAVSNLIAMGEVSAEEIGDRKPMEDRAPRGGAPAGGNGVPTMPFGKTKGKPLTEIDAEDLGNAAKWAQEKGKFLDFVEQAKVELRRRAGASTSPSEPDGPDDRGPDSEEGPNGMDLPF